MTNQTIRGALALAMATSLLACAELPDDVAVEDEAVATAAQDKSADQPTLIPLVVTLYEHPNYEGYRRDAYENEPFVGRGEGCSPGLGFENVTTSVQVRRGPDYDRWMREHGGHKPYVYLHQDDLYRGRRIALTVGGYPDLRDLYFDNQVSSLSIQPESMPPANLREPAETVRLVDPVSIILEAHTEPSHLRCSGNDEKMTLIWGNFYIRAFYGPAFDNRFSSIDILRGTRFDPNMVFWLYDDLHDEGSRRRGFYHDEPSIPDLRDYHLDDQISAIGIQSPDR
jgi:hypothetical protein